MVAGDRVELRLEHDGAKRAGLAGQGGAGLAALPLPQHDQHLGGGGLGGEGFACFLFIVHIYAKKSLLLLYQDVWFSIYPFKYNVFGSGNMYIYLI